MSNTALTATLDGDWHVKAEPFPHVVLYSHGDHAHCVFALAAQAQAQHFGPITITEMVQDGKESVSAVLATPFSAIPLGHFDASVKATHPISVKLDSGNYFVGNLTLA